MEVCGWLNTECTPNTMFVPGLSPCGEPASARCTMLACRAGRESSERERHKKKRERKGKERASRAAHSAFVRGGKVVHPGPAGSLVALHGLDVLLEQHLLLEGTDSNQ